MAAIIVPAGMPGGAYQVVGLVSGGGGGSALPGDIVSGWSAFWGSVAYNTASIGNAAYDVDGDTTVTSFTLVTKSGGLGIELSAGGAAAFLAANTGAVRVKKEYDQTGNGRHKTASALLRPFFIPTGAGLVRYNNTNHVLRTASGFAVSQPLSAFAIANLASSGAVQCVMSDSTGWQFMINGTPALRLQSNSAFNGGAVSTSTWYALQGVFNGASSVATVNGSDSTGNPGTNGTTAGHTLSSGNDDFNEELFADMICTGVLPAAFSSGQRTSLDGLRAALGI